MNGHRPVSGSLEFVDIDLVFSSTWLTMLALGWRKGAREIEGRQVGQKASRTA
jgi:hypothetical protein